MQEHHTFEIKEFISKAKHSVQLYSRSPIPPLILDYLFLLLEQRISLDLFIGEAIPENVESEPYYLYKIIHLGKEGANLYNGKQFFGNRAIICQRDYNQIIRLDIENDVIESFTSDQEEFKSFRSLLELQTASEDEFRKEPGDIQIHFKTDDKISLKNSKVGVEWKVENAERVEIDMLGIVENEGTDQIRITEDLIINLYASNKKFKKARSIFIPVAERPKIFYDVQFLNPSSNEFVSLPEESGLGVFGVTKGNKVRVVWDVSNAQDVLVEPFGLNEHQGEVEFFVNGQFKLEISATLQEASEAKRLLIQEFPVPVFTEALVQINPDFLKNGIFDLKDVRLRAVHYLEAIGAVGPTGSKGFWKMTSRSNKQINSLLKSPRFTDFYNDHSILRLNKSIAERIRGYFRNEPSVLTVIKSIQKYYE